MKNLIIATLSFVFFGFASMTSADAQRIAIVDVNQIMSEMSSYQSAQAELDNIASQWRQEISQKMDEVKSLYNKYQAEQVLLTEEMKKEAEDKITTKEAEVRELQKKRFGPDGDLTVKTEQLIAPIQEEVASAIKEYADSRGYDVIFDKSSAAGILFSNEALDKTVDIKRKLGI